MSIPDSKDEWESFITTRNNSGTVIGKRSLRCNIIRLTADQEHDVGYSSITTVANDVLEIGGDAETRGCLDIANGKGALRWAVPIICADVKVAVNYTADTSPGINGTKEARFVFGFAGKRTWVQQPVSRAGTYCR